MRGLCDSCIFLSTVKFTTWCVRDTKFIVGNEFALVIQQVGVRGRTWLWGRRGLPRWRIFAATVSTFECRNDDDQ